MSEVVDKIIAENYASVGDLPVSVCVLTIESSRLAYPIYVVGVSTSSREKFNLGIARAFALRNAERNIQAALDRCAPR